MALSDSLPYEGAPSLSPQKVWQAALGELQLQVTSDIYEMYLHPTRFLAYEDGTFLITVPNGFVKDWLDVRLNRIIKRTLRHIINREVEVRYTVHPQAVRDLDRAAQVPLLEFLEDEEQAADLPAPSTSAPSSGGLPLVADYTFDTFIVGSNNRMAHAAAVSVADRPGGRYNPLFIYSGVGLGKTHLMHAIGHRARQSGRRAVYVSCEVFTNDLVGAIRTNTQDQFRSKYRTNDVLLVDDVQFLVGKSSTQEEFFHTFNALHEAGSQVVLACDRPPKAMTTLESRLRSRFEWGLIADIQPPDLEMRLAILQAKAAAHGAALPHGILEQVAHLVPTNIRELEGALTKVMAHATLNGVHLTPEAVEDILADMLPRKTQAEPEEVVALVAREFGISVEDLTGARRKRELVRARQVAMYLLREELELSYAAIGTLIGGRDHATAMHSVNKIGDLLEDDDEIQRSVDRLRGILTAPTGVLVRVRG